MHSADDSMNRSAACQISDVLKRVDHTGMPAAKQHDRPLAGVEEHRLVVQQGIHVLPMSVNEERSTRVLILRPTRDLTSHEHSADYLRGPLDQSQ